uniref:DUF834 domain-containing protein n=1 Tax=Oryza sativa subsp. japonica TaxID=39947 RepID=Q337U6_ORYSJ|nr:hypothetical protein LOC_Os10g30270 [Oryza sativa Japonica Group]
MAVPVVEGENGAEAGMELGGAMPAVAAAWRGGGWSGEERRPSSSVSGGERERGGEVVPAMEWGNGAGPRCGTVRWSLRRWLRGAATTRAAVAGGRRLPASGGDGVRRCRGGFRAREGSGERGKERRRCGDRFIELGRLKSWPGEVGLADGSGTPTWGGGGSAGVGFCGLSGGNGGEEGGQRPRRTRARERDGHARKCRDVGRQWRHGRLPAREAEGWG